MSFNDVEMNYYTGLFYSSMRNNSTAAYWEHRASEIFHDDSIKSYQTKIKHLERALKDYYEKNTIVYPERFEALQRANDKVLSSTNWHTIALELMRRTIGNNENN